MPFPFVFPHFVTADDVWNFCSISCLKMSNQFPVNPSTDMDTFRKIIKNAKKIVILTGAGVSAESGVPTFRGAGGLWRTYNAMGKL